jgi:hypothetical protein
MQPECLGGVLGGMGEWTARRLRTNIQEHYYAKPFGSVDLRREDELRERRRRKVARTSP